MVSPLLRSDAGRLADRYSVHGCRSGKCGPHKTTGNRQVYERGSLSSNSESHEYRPGRCGQHRSGAAAARNNGYRRRRNLRPAGDRPEAEPQTRPFPGHISSSPDTSRCAISRSVRSGNSGVFPHTCTKARRKVERDIYAFLLKVSMEIFFSKFP